jgi:hypothetical protein
MRADASWQRYDYRKIVKYTKTVGKVESALQGGTFSSEVEMLCMACRCKVVDLSHLSSGDHFIEPRICYTGLVPSKHRSFGPLLRRTVQEYQEKCFEWS